MRSLQLLSLLLPLLLVPPAARAAVEGPGRGQFLRPGKAAGPVVADGTLDEPAWAEAPAFTDFVQRFPVAGAPPSETTELRVMEDGALLYVAVKCHDSRPALIDRRLGRRDAELSTDAVTVIIDAAHDHRTAYAFSLTAGGVQGDGLYFDDRNFTRDWDGVWAGAVAVHEGGWTAEFAIPLWLLRFPAAPVQTWGFGVRRTVARLNEEIDSVDNPRTSNATVSRLGHLTGMEGLSPRRATELLPYLAVRGVARPQYSDALRPQPRLVGPSGDVGLDARVQLTSDLTLTGTLNPDFGQVEADQLILNLSTFENFFPERRPFFQQGLELFQPVGQADGTPSQSLFYSRRIGLAAPILGAVKMTGNVGRVEVGLLDAVVLGAEAGAVDEEAPDMRVTYRPQRPLHLGPGWELPGRVPAPTNFFTGVARLGLGAASRLGVTASAATPLAAACTPEEAALPAEGRPASCTTRGGNAAAADFDLRTADGTWGALGQASVSQQVGGAPERTLLDGTVLRRGDVGGGAFARAGRVGGEGLRGEVGYDWLSPTLELNATGFQRNQNVHGPTAWLRYVRPNGWGALKSGSINGVVAPRWTADARGVYRGTEVNVNATLQLPSFDFIGGELGVSPDGFDVREVRGSGVPVEQARSHYTAAWVETNPNRTWQLFGFAALGYRGQSGPTAPRVGWAGELGGTLRPHPALETRLVLNADYTPHGPRYLETLDDNRFLFGELESYFLSATLRQQWVLRPNLSLQAYAQLFTAFGQYGRTFEGVSDAARTPILLSSLTPVGESDADFYDTSLNLNVVLRWEYRLGSTLFLVYTRAESGLPGAAGTPPPATLAPRGLGRGPATDALLLKWTYYWSV